MKLYDGLGPNPQVVRMFLAEVGTEVETVTVDIMACLLYTSDAADDTPCVDLGGRRIIKKKSNGAGSHS